MILDLNSSNRTLPSSCNFEIRILKSNHFLRTVKKHECHNIIFPLQQLNFVFHLSITVQLQLTVLYTKFLLAGKSKQTRGVTALRDIGLTMGCRERQFWKRAESLEIVHQFLCNGGGIKTNQERTSLGKGG